tara:strand:- start:612 stop:749 length:138 start_codon:yes stop_codon:yes gene_type:complete
MQKFNINTVIVTAGALVLAIARELILTIIETIIFEEKGDFGTIKF